MSNWTIATGSMPGSYYEPAGGGVADGSGDNAYMVWFWPGGKAECECATYRVFGKGCKHISLMKDAIRRDQKLVGVISYFGKSK